MTKVTVEDGGEIETSELLGPRKLPLQIAPAGAVLVLCAPPSEASVRAFPAFRTVGALSWWTLHVCREPAVGPRIFNGVLSDDLLEEAGCVVG